MARTSVLVIKGFFVGNKNRSKVGDRHTRTITVLRVVFNDVETFRGLTGTSGTSRAHVDMCDRLRLVRANVFAADLPLLVQCAVSVTFSCANFVVRNLSYDVYITGYVVVSLARQGRQHKDCFCFFDNKRATERWSAESEQGSNILLLVQTAWSRRCDPLLDTGGSWFEKTANPLGWNSHVGPAVRRCNTIACRTPMSAMARQTCSFTSLDGQAVRQWNYSLSLRKTSWP
jgi:hypothetical protein